MFWYICGVCRVLSLGVGLHWASSCLVFACGAVATLSRTEGVGLKMESSSFFPTTSALVQHHVYLLTRST
jgi:hypothetical protein